MLIARQAPLCGCGIFANRFGPAILTTRSRPEQLLFEPLGLIEREMARAPAVINRLAYESWSKMRRVRVPDGACSRRDWHAFDPLYVFRREIRVVKRQALRHGPANAKLGWQRHMDLGGARIRQAVDGERGFVRDDALRIGPAHLRPQCGFHVLPERRDRISRQAIHTAGSLARCRRCGAAAQAALDEGQPLAPGPQ